MDWSYILDVLQQVGIGLGFVLVALVCVAGVILSCVSLSGTWLVTLAALGAMFLSSSGFPDWWTIGTFLVLSGMVEGVEAVASSWGVVRRGGSRWAGWAALGGGLAGMILGAGIPIPLVGSLLGMLLGSFGLTYLVEWRRLKRTEPAAHIAMGAVVGRVLVILVKVVVTLGMMTYLLVGLVVN